MITLIAFIACTLLAYCCIIWLARITALDEGMKLRVSCRGLLLSAALGALAWAVVYLCWMMANA